MKLNWRARGPWTMCLTAFVFVMGLAGVSAQGDQMVPYVPGQQGTVSASPLVLTAYAFVWAAVLVYVFLLWRRIGRVEHELAEVNAKLSSRTRS